MEYVIHGGKQLKGEIAVSGAKNSALKLIIAGLLLKGKSTIHNVPRISDVLVLVEIINYLGGKAEFTDTNTVEIENKLKKFQIPLEIAGKTRVSILLIAPLLHCFGKAVLPNPGGCRLGARSVDRLIESVNVLGAEIRYDSADGNYYAKLKQNSVKQFHFKKKTHIGTELALMFCSRLGKEVLIKNAAQEPEVNDLIAYLNQAGALVQRQGENIIIKGKTKLHSTTFVVQSDRIEAVSFIILSSLFQGNIRVNNVEKLAIEPFLAKYEQAGFKYHYSYRSKQFIVMNNKQIKPVNIETAPHPGFLTDWQPIWALLMTKAEGESRIHETVFENRFAYVKELNKFGTAITFYDPKVVDPETVYQFNDYDPYKHNKQAIKIKGPSQFHNAYAKMTDIRAGACLVLAALVAKGTSIISGAEQIERGYENLLNRLTRLGAEIKINSTS